MGIKEFRVFGPPGCGKTTYLSRQIERACKSYGSERILVCSFTKAAAAELVGRSLPVDKNRIGTLHSFAHRAIGRPEIADTPKWISVWNGTIRPEWRLSGGKASVDDPYHEVASDGSKSDGDRMLSAYSIVRNRLLLSTIFDLVPIDQIDEDPIVIRYLPFSDDARKSLSRSPLPARPEEWRPWAVEWERFKRENSLRDFTDLIEVSLRVAYCPFDVDVGFFDEVQDFSALELALVRKWGGSMQRIVLAGDDDQCIYSFRGATPDAFLWPEIPHEHVTILSRSFRLPRSVKTEAEKVCALLGARRKEKPFEARDFDGAVERSDIGIATSELIVQAVEREVRDGAKSIMVLALCGFFLDPIINRLRGLGIPYWNPYRVSNGRWNPFRNAHERILNYLITDVSVWGSRARSHSWSSVWSWFELLDTKKLGCKRGAKKLCKMRAESNPDSDVLFDEFVEDLGFSPPPRGDLEWLAKNLLDSKSGCRAGLSFAFQVARRRGGAALFERPKVIVGTIHSVKGGEADTVFLLPDLSYAAEREAQTIGGRDALRRVYYVGMTRARKKLVLCRARRVGFSDCIWRSEDE